DATSKGLIRPPTALDGHEHSRTGRGSVLLTEQRESSINDSGYSSAENIPKTIHDNDGCLSVYSVESLPEQLQNGYIKAFSDCLERDIRRLASSSEPSWQSCGA